MKQRRVKYVYLLVKGAAIIALLVSVIPGQAQSLRETDEQPFIMPFAGDPGPGTWLFIQPYGNTTFAYKFRNSTAIQHLPINLEIVCIMAGKASTLGSTWLHHVGRRSWRSVMASSTL
jgi:hypothetical protein